MFPFFVNCSLVCRVVPEWVKSDLVFSFLSCAVTSFSGLLYIFGRFESSTVKRRFCFVRFDAETSWLFSWRVTDELTRILGRLRPAAGRGRTLVLISVSSVFATFSLLILVDPVNVGFGWPARLDSSTLLALGLYCEADRLCRCFVVKGVKGAISCL